MRGDRRRLPFRALQRRHIGRRRSLRVRPNVVVGDLELARGIPPIVSASPWHRARVFHTMIFRSCEHALRLPRKRRALSNWKMSSRPPNVRVGGHLRPVTSMGWRRWRSHPVLIVSAFGAERKAAVGRLPNARASPVSSVSPHPESCRKGML